MDSAAQVNGWSDAYKERMQKLLSVDYMSSESSAEESETEGDTVARSFLRVKRIPWLKRKYRDAFHAIDKVYYATHRRSRDKLKRRVQSGNSTRPLPDDAPRFSLKMGFHSCEVGTEQGQEMDLNDSSLSESSPVDINDSSQSQE